MPVPARVGDLSTIKHVFLIVKENRTYDQMYGDDSRGDGDPKLAQFGGAVSPNQHLINKQFGLYDNVYDIGTNSAEGHNWLMQGDDPEYTAAATRAAARTSNFWIFPVAVFGSSSTSCTLLGTWNPASRVFA